MSQTTVGVPGSPSSQSIDSLWTELVFRPLIYLVDAATPRLQEKTNKTVTHFQFY